MSTAFPTSSSSTDCTSTFEGIDRPLEAYCRALSRAGFLIEELREPRPTPAARAAAPALAKAARRPYFLHMRCVLARD